MTDWPAGRGERVIVLALPAVIDLSNAWKVGEEVLAAFDGGVRSVVADLSATSRCSAAGGHYLALACQQAASRNADLRLVVPPGSEALRVFTLTGHDRWLPVYPNLAAALGGSGHQPDVRTSSWLAPAR